MPLEGQTPIVSYAVEANTINAGAFTINPATLSITITYELGNIKDGSFERIKEPDTVHFEAADLLPHLAANPDLYPKLKGIVYALLKKRNGLDETYLVV